MLLVVLLAVASSTCASLSTVFKHRSAQRATQPGSRGPTWMPDPVVAWVANPTFALAMLFDAMCVGFQVAALKFGSLSVVQPVLCMALVISLGLSHVLNRTRPRRAELVYAVTLVAGLVTFLFVSDSISAHGEAAIGRKLPGAILAVVGGIVVLGALFGTRRARPRVRARALAVAVAVIYATTAGLMKSSTQIAHLHGVAALLQSWQLWVLLALAALGLVVNQLAFADAPLHVALPVIASLDPLFSVVIGVGVYSEHLRSTPLALAGEALGLVTLLYSVARLSSVRAEQETVAALMEPAVHVAHDGAARDDTTRGVADEAAGGSIRVGDDAPGARR